MERTAELSPWEFIASPRRRIGSAKRRRKIFLQVFSAHVLILFAPFILALVDEYLHPAETEFRIELMNPPSTGEEVGPPERTPEAPPAENPPAEPDVNSLPDPAPPEPDVNSLPDPELPPPPEPRVKLPRVTAVKPPREPDVRLPKVPRPPTVKTPDKVKPPVNTPPKNTAGGWNKNSLVPLGTKDLAQMKGPNSGTAPGGMGKSDPQYPGKVAEFLKQLWQTPSGIFLDGRNADVLIRLTISGNGTITGKEVLRYSGVSAMDDSVRALLRRVERVPAPSDGKPLSLEIILRPEN